MAALYPSIPRGEDVNADMTMDEIKKSIRYDYVLLMTKRGTKFGDKTLSYLPKSDLIKVLNKKDIRVRDRRPCDEVNEILRERVAAKASSKKSASGASASAAVQGKTTHDAIAAAKSASASAAAAKLAAASAVAKDVEQSQKVASAKSAAEAASNAARAAAKSAASAAAAAAASASKRLRGYPYDDITIMTPMRRHLTFERMGLYKFLSSHVPSAEVRIPDTNYYVNSEKAADFVSTGVYNRFYMAATEDDIVGDDDSAQNYVRLVPSWT